MSGDQRNHAHITIRRTERELMAKKATKRAASKSRVPNSKTAKSSRPNSKSRKYVYFFGGGKADGNRTMKDLLGGKGAGLAEMTNAGLPVPPGFTISTEVCMMYYKGGAKVPPAVEKEMLAALKRLEQVAKASFGSKTNPLLVSVRSG